MAQPDAVVQQRLLEAEAAAQRKAHEVVLPKVGDVGGFGDQHAVAPDPVARQVAAHVDAHTQRRQAHLARLTHGQHRARLGVALAITLKISGQ